tara:strand:- start:1084 stop:1551 length:468 start_codon:yes stop_codon:yes gene_type:complete
MKDELVNALIKFQSQVEDVKNDSENPYFKSGYASLGAVIESVKELLNKNGIYFQQIAHEKENALGVETVLFGHGSSISSGVVFMPTTKNDPHAFGSALTYAKRYSLMMACGLRSEDDDGNTAVDKSKKFSNQKMSNKTAYQSNPTPTTKSSDDYF